MPYYVRIGSSLVLAAATSLVGCGGNPGDSVPVTVDESKAATPDATAPQAKGKPSQKFIPRSSGRK